MNSKAFANFIIKFEIGCKHQARLEKIITSRCNADLTTRRKWHKDIVNEVWERLG